MTNAEGTLAWLEDAHPVSNVAIVITVPIVMKVIIDPRARTARWPRVLISFPSLTSLTKPDQRKLDAIAPACCPATYCVSKPPAAKGETGSGRYRRARDMGNILAGGIRPEKPLSAGT